MSAILIVFLSFYFICVVVGFVSSLDLFVRNDYPWNSCHDVFLRLRSLLSAFLFSLFCPVCVLIDAGWLYNCFYIEDDFVEPDTDLYQATVQV
jgi:hypothetical protein